MPKEISHWTLAAAVADALPEESLFLKPIRSFPNLFLLGAIAPDILFYYLAGPKTAAVQALSAPFHGTDGRALGPVLAFLDRHPDKNPAVLSFAAGVVCHILADTLFHPLVYYYAGMDGVHPGANARHRQFETAMDLYFLHLSQGRSPVSLARVIKYLEISKTERYRLMADLFQAERRPGKRYLGPALYSHTTLQYLFRSVPAYKVFAFLNQKTPWVPDKVVGLIYPVNRPLNLEFFSRPLKYQDPCTGEAFSVRIKDMMVQTGMAGKKLFHLISAALVQDKPAIEVMDHPDLPKIRPGVARENFVFWRGKDDLVSDLYGGLYSHF